MDHIHNEFGKYEDDLNIPAPIRSGISLAKKTLDRYYTKTDDVEIYRIAMSRSFLTFINFTELIQMKVLHPRHKLAYF